MLPYPSPPAIQVAEGSSFQMRYRMDLYFKWFEISNLLLPRRIRAWKHIYKGIYYIRLALIMHLDMCLSIISEACNIK